VSSSTTRLIRVRLSTTRSDSSVIVSCAIGRGGQLEQHVVPGQRQSRAGAKLPVENRHQLRMHLE
jgi:hypothetical protein